MILNKKEIKERLKFDPPMVENIKDLSVQLQPCGLDLTVKKIFKWKDRGYIDFDNSKRKLPKRIELIPEDYNYVYYYLPQGVYQVEVNETFNIPDDVASVTISRSSLQRCGAAILSGFFDPGFYGNGVCLLEVYNSKGIIIYPDARICQMIFHFTNKTEKYNGIYNIK